MITQTPELFPTQNTLWSEPSQPHNEGSHVVDLTQGNTLHDDGLRTNNVDFGLEQGFCFRGHRY